MKKVWIVSLFGSPLDDNSRLSNIYKYLGDDIEKIVITTDFDHGSKKYRDKTNLSNIYFIHVPQYKKNISIKRVYSHLVFSIKLRSFIEKLPKPDALYCTMPTSTSAFVCGKFCRKNDICFIIDILDLWPDSLFPINKAFKLLKWMFYPWKYITIKAYKYANIIIGESYKYAEIASCYNPEVPVYSLYLGVDREQIISLKAKSNFFIEKPKNQVWICYAGSLGASYDFDCLLQAVRQIPLSCNYKILFIGDGDKRSYLEQKIKEYDLNGIITGRISYSDYLKYLSYCDIGVNIFKRNTLVVHSYKFNDYVASGLFILNSLEGETAILIDKYKIGLNFNFIDKPLKTVLSDVCLNWNIYNQYRQNNTKFIDEILDKNIIYSSIISKILK